MSNSDLTELTASRARVLLDKREISSVDLTKALLNKISDIDNSIKSFVTVTSDLAIKQAEKADKRIKENKIDGLTGIPVQIKDNICTSGVKTTCSSKMLENFVPPYNATIVDKLYDSGAILLGKGNLDEFAMGSSTENSYFYPTKNPWDMMRVPGGSSGGPAASVSSNQVIASLGSDTGGSIRQPASLCGVVGLKPTYGLVSRYGLIAFASSLDQIGPITKDVTDSALLLNTISGYDSKDATSINLKIPDYCKYLKEDLSGMKIAIPKDYFGDDIDSGVKKVVYEAIEVLKNLGASIEEISLSVMQQFALAVYYIIAPSEASANLSRYDGVKYGFSDRLNSEDLMETLYKTRQNGFGSEVKRRIMLGTYALSSGYYDAYYLKAQEAKRMIKSEYEDTFKKYDAIITPTSPTVAFKIGEKSSNPVQMYLSDVLTIPANIAGIPAKSIPSGFSEGLPVGMQIISSRLREDTIFNIAYAYERATNWNKFKPNFDKLKI